MMNNNPAPSQSQTLVVKTVVVRGVFGYWLPLEDRVFIVQENRLEVISPYSNWDPEDGLMPDLSLPLAPAVVMRVIPRDVLVQMSITDYADETLEVLLEPTIFIDQ